jgi:hypothetical protein
VQLALVDVAGGGDARHLMQKQRQFPVLARRVI